MTSGDRDVSHALLPQLCPLHALAATIIIFTCATDLFDSELSDCAWLCIKIIVHTQ